MFRTTFKNTADTSKAVRKLKDDGLVQRSGLGGKGSPFLYKVSPALDLLSACYSLIWLYLHWLVGASTAIFASCRCYQTIHMKYGTPVVLVAHAGCCCSRFTIFEGQVHGIH